MNFEEIVGQLKPEHAEIVKGVVQKAKDELDAAIQRAEAAESEVAVAKSAGKSEAELEEEIVKSIKDPAVKALMEVQISKRKAAEAAIAKAKEAELETEAISKAKEASNVGAEEAKLAEVYKKLKNTDAELANEVFGIFKAASALIAEGGALQEIGKSASGGESNLVDADNAWAKIESAASEIAKTQKISQAQAITKAIDANPELYNAYVSGLK